MKVTRKERDRARIEMIPLIDVIFLLLVAFIFFAMSMTIYRGIPVDLPVSSASRVGDEDFWEITVEKSGAVYFNEKEVDLQDLRLRLVLLQRRSPGAKIIVSGDREAPYESIVSVMDAVKNVGISGLLLRTDFSDERLGRVPENTVRDRE